MKNSPESSTITAGTTTLSYLVKCDGTFLFYFPKCCLILIFHLNFLLRYFFYFRTGLALTIQRSTKRDCVDITAATAKETPTGGIAGTGVGWACTSTESVIGIELSQFNSASCTMATYTDSEMTIASGQCTLEGGDVKTAGGLKISCDGFLSTDEKDEIFFRHYERGDVNTSPKCEKEIAFGTWPYTKYDKNDGKCFTVKGNSAADTPADTKATPSPGGKKQSTQSDASTNVLATGFAVAGMIVSLVLM